MNDKVFHYEEIGCPCEEDSVQGISTTGWYFWDEEGKWAYGPYKTEEVAVDHCSRYYDVIAWAEAVEASFHEV